MEHINPWVAILDIPWFITKLKVLEIPPDTRAHLKTRGLMPDTPVWTDRELAMLYRENSMEQFEVDLSFAHTGHLWILFFLCSYTDVYCSYSLKLISYYFQLF